MPLTPVDKQIDRLQATLLTTGLQIRDNPTFQVLTQLIGIAKALQAEITGIVVDDNTTNINTTVVNSNSNAALALIGAEDRLDDKDTFSYVPGPIGATGNTGVAGNTGISGQPGIDGIDGADGVDGISIVGPTGATGARGLSGINGLDGEDGQDSLIPGPQGIQGIQGNTGATGFTGSPGQPGIDGIDGTDGIDGISIIGPRGLSGINGVNGLNGIDGEDGQDSLIPGNQGIQGIQGIQGPTGPSGTGSGSVGPPGLDGVDGLDALSLPFGYVNTEPVATYGQWAPIDSSGAGLTFTFTANNCNWIRIGRFIVASFVITWPATVNAASALIGGLPFTCFNSTNACFGIPFFITTEPTAYAAVVGQNTTTFQPLTAAGGTISNAVLSGDTLRGTIVYLSVP